METIENQQLKIKENDKHLENLRVSLEVSQLREPGEKRIAAKEQETRYRTDLKLALDNISTVYFYYSNAPAKQPTVEELDGMTRAITSAEDAIRWGLKQKTRRRVVVMGLLDLAKLPRDRSFYQDLLEFSLKIFRANLDIIEKEIAKTIEQKTHANFLYFKVLALVAEKSDFSEQAKPAVEMLEKFWDELKWCAQEIAPETYAGFLATVARYGSEAKRIELRQFTEGLINEGERQTSREIIAALLGVGYSIAYHEGASLLAHFLKPYGLEMETHDLLNAWRMAGPQDNFRTRVSDNISSIQLLEMARWLSKDFLLSVKFLYKNFGIKNFARYPTKLLSEQYERREDAERPYGIILNPYADHNGAFSQNISVWSELEWQLGMEQYNIRVVEAGTKMEIARKLLELDKKYGQKQKISFAIIGGHGEIRQENEPAYRIQFGSGQTMREYLYLADLLGRGVRKVGRFFIKNPTIILNSCSTGTDIGIAREISEIIPGAKLIAPEIPTAIKSIKVNEKDEKLNFQVEYWQENAKREFVAGQSH